MDVSNINTDLIRGNVNNFILRSLLDEDRYGYDILKEIELKSGGVYKLKQPTLYSCLKRLEKQGLIYSYLGDEDQTEGGRRRYYALTEEGRAYLIKMKTEYEFSRTIIDRLLSDETFDLENGNAPFDVNGLRPYTKRKGSDDEDEKMEAVQEIIDKSLSDEDQDAAPVVEDKYSVTDSESLAEAESPVDDDNSSETVTVEAAATTEEEPAETKVETVEIVKAEKPAEEKPTEPALPKQKTVLEIEDDGLSYVDVTKPERDGNVKRSLSDMLSGIENKIGENENEAISKTLKTSTASDKRSDIQEKREYYRPEKLVSNTYPDEPAENTRREALTEEQRRARSVASEKLGIGKFADPNSYNYERFGIQRPTEKADGDASDEDSPKRRR